MSSFFVVVIYLTFLVFNKRGFFCAAIHGIQYCTRDIIFSRTLFYIGDWKWYRSICIFFLKKKFCLVFLRYSGTVSEMLLTNITVYRYIFTFKFWSCLSVLLFFFLYIFSCLELLCHKKWDKFFFFFFNTMMPFLLYETKFNKFIFPMLEKDWCFVFYLLIP